MNGLKRHIVLLVLSITSFTATGQTEFQLKNLAAFCKVWGFLKYYHPYPSKKGVDWDKVLVDNYPKVKAAQSKTEFNNILLSIIKPMDMLKLNKHPFIPVDSLSKNADFKWMLDTNTLNNELCTYLQFIKKNHKPFKNRFIGRTYWFNGNTKIKEKSYPEMVFPDEEYRFLSLSRYWNIIQYYFPDKYLMDSNWNISLERAIPIFLNACDTEEYYRAIEWITARTNDSHASYVRPSFRPSSRYYVPPFTTFYHCDTLTVSYIASDSIANIISVKKGDEIVSINGKSVKELWQDVKSHHSASNETYAESTFANIFTLAYSKKDTSILKIIREGKEITTIVKNYPVYALFKMWKGPKQRFVNTFNIIKDSISGKKYGYVNTGKLREKDVNKLMKEMNGIEYLVLDVRNYPYIEGWLKLANKLISGKRYVAMYSQPDYKHPGYIEYHLNERFGTNSKNYYKGKVIILIDHMTMSQAEYETMALRLAPNTTVIGSQTAGADGNIATVVFPGNYSVWFTGLGWFYADGRQTQRIGIIPDIKVNYTLKSELEGIDPMIEKALELIRTGK